MIVSIHQPAYLPWLGYFHKIALSDVFVFLDTTQFEKNSFVNRNRIKTPQGPLWLTVPVSLQGHLTNEIGHTAIAGQHWRDKHWRTLELNYRKAPFWLRYAPELEKTYRAGYATIDQLCFDQLLLFNRWLGLGTRIVRSSELPPTGSRKQHLVLDLCKSVRASLYVSGALGRGYLEQKAFSREGIALYFQDYQHPVYPQLWSPEFLANLSIVDLLFNEGPDSFKTILEGNVTKTALLTNSTLYA
jgi:hypothetical protein